MKIVGERMRELRESVNLSQAKMAKQFKVGQASIFRYETGDTSPPDTLLVQYADFFDVSMDYIFGRTDKPQGKLYTGEPKLEKSYPEMQQFIEMCFDPKSPMSKRLKETLMQMLKEEGTS